MGARRLCVDPAPDGKPYPNLAQHALREAKVLARNIHGVLNGQPPQPFVYNTLGMMGSLGHSRAFGQLLKVRVHGVLAWFVRRTYYLLQMPGWSRRLRIMIDWTFALLFRPDIVKISLDSEDGASQCSARRSPSWRGDGERGAPARQSRRAEASRTSPMGRDARRHRLYADERQAGSTLLAEGLLTCHARGSAP